MEANMSRYLLAVLSLIWVTGVVGAQEVRRGDKFQAQAFGTLRVYNQSISNITKEFRLGQTCEPDRWGSVVVDVVTDDLTSVRYVSTQTVYGDTCPNGVLSLLRTEVLRKRKAEQARQDDADFLEKMQRQKK